MSTTLTIGSSGSSQDLSGSGPYTYTGTGRLSAAGISSYLAGASVTLSADTLSFETDAPPPFTFTGLSGATLSMNAGTGGFSLSSAQSISVGPGVNLTLNVTGASLVLPSTITITGGVLTLTGSGVSVGGALTTGGGAVTVSAGSYAVTTSAAITTGGPSSGGAIGLSGGSVTLGGNVDATVIGGGAAGAVTLTATNADVSQTAGRVKGGVLTATAMDSGDVTLTNALNAVASATLSGADVSLSNSQALTLAGATATAGHVTVTTSGGALTVTGAVASTSSGLPGQIAQVSLTGDSVALQAGVSTTDAGGQVTLTSRSGGAITQTAGGVITAGTLTTTGAGAVTLTNSANSVAGANLSGSSVAFFDGTALQLGTTTASSGAVSVTASDSLRTNGVVTAAAGSSVTLAGKSVTLGGAVSASGGTVTLTSTAGVVTQTSGAITAGSLSATATGGAVTLTDANAVANASLSGAGVSFMDGADLTLTSVTSTGGNALTVNDGAKALTVSGPVSLTGGSASSNVTLTGGAITLAGSVSAGAGVIALTGGSGAMTQTSGVLTAGTLTETSSGAVSLTGANAVGSASLSGTSVSFTDTRDLVLTSASVTGGGALTVTTSGALALAANAVSATGTVALTGKSVSGGALTLPGGATVTTTGAATSDGVALGALTLSGASPVTLTSAKGIVGLMSADSATAGQASLLVSAANGSFSSGALGAGGALAAFGVKAQSATITGTSSVATLAATLTGAGQGFTLNDGSAALNVGSAAGGYVGLTTNGGASSLTAGSLSVSAAVNVGAGSLALTASGAGGVGQSAAITAATVTVTASGGGGGVALSGPVSVSGGLSVTTSGAATLSGVVSGAGGLTLSATGGATVSAVNTYLGATTLSAGAVTSTKAGAFGTGAVSDASSLTFSGASGTVANAVSGAGALSVTGVGAGATLTFSGALTQTGGFTVSDASNVTIGASGSYAAPKAIRTSGGAFNALGSAVVSSDDGLVPLSGGTVTVGSAGDATAKLMGANRGIDAGAGPLAVANYGLVDGVQYDGVLYFGTGTLTLNNFGTGVIYGEGSGFAGVTSNGEDGDALLSVTNATGGVIVGGGYGVYGINAGDSVVNAGVIASGSYATPASGPFNTGAVTIGGVAAVNLDQGGAVTNEAGGVIESAYPGAVHTTVTPGAIVAQGPLKLSNAGQVVMGAGAATNAVFAKGDASAVLNAAGGSISTTGAAALEGGAGLTVVNAAGATLAGGSDAASGYAVHFAGGTGSFDTFGTANANGRGVTVSNAVDGSATGTGVTVTLEAGSTTGALALAGQDDTVTLYTGAVTTAADTRTDPVSGASVTVRAAGTYATAAFSTLALGGGANVLNLRGAGDQGLQGAAGSLALTNLSATGGSVVLNKLDAGTWTLTGSSAGTGLTRINAGNGTPSGLLSFNGTSDLTAPIYVNGAQISAATAGAFGHGSIHAVDPTMTYGAAGTYDNAIVLESADAINDPAKFQNGLGYGAVVTLSGAITQGSGTNTDNQTVAANQAVTFAGETGGVFALTGSGNSWTGATTVNAGVTLRGSTSQVSGGSIVDNGTLQYLNQSNATLTQPISGAGGVTFDNGATYTIAAGTAETYTGATTLAAAVLKLDGSLTSAINVQSSTTLQGTGSTTGAVTVSGPSAVFAPGEGTGTFTAASLSLIAPATFSEAITGAGAFGRFVATSAAAGAVSLGGSLTLTYTGGAEAYGTVYTFIQETGGGTVTGAFSNAADGVTLTSGGHAFRVNYTSTAVTLTDLTNTAPVLGGSGAASATDDQHTATPLSAVTVTDPDAGQTQTATVSFASANGTLAGLGSATVANGTATYTVTGAAVSVQAALRAAVFTPRANQVAPGAAASTTFTVNDTDSTGAAATTAATATLTTTSVNDAPTFGGSHASTVGDRGTDAPFTGVTVADADTGQGETVTVTLSDPASGTLSGGGFAQTATPGVYTYAAAAGAAGASAAAAQTALRALTFTPTAAPAGPDTQTTFTVAVTDGANASSGADMGTVVTVTHGTNTTPTVAGTHVSTTGDRTADALFSAVTVTDPDTPAQAETAIISFAAANGTLTNAGPATVASGTATYTINAASAPALTTALQALTFQPTTAPSGTANTSTTVTLSVTDAAGGSSGADMSTVVTATHTTNTAPSVAGTHASTTGDRTADALFSAVTVTDPDTPAQAETATISFAAANGTLANAGVATVAGGVATYTVGAASAQALTTALQAVIFQPTTAPAGAANTGTTVTLSVTDAAGASSGADMGTMVTVTHTTNTPPAVSGTHASTTGDRTADALFSGVIVTDPDTPAQAETATISFTAVNGTLAGAGAATVANGTATYTVSAASASALTTALQALAFQPTPAPAGAAATTTPVSLSVIDGAGASSPVDTSTVVTAAHTTNTAVQAANANPSQSITDKGTTTLFQGVTVTDPDSGQTETATITYAAANGTLAGAGAAIVSNGVAAYTLSAASAAALQTALQAVVFTPTANQTSPSQTVTTAFTVSVSDESATASVADTVTVTSVNDPPSVSGTHASSTGDRSADSLFSGVTVTDPDTPAQAETATISFAAANGTLAGAGTPTVAGGSATYTVSAASASALTTALQAVTFTPAAAPAGAAPTATTMTLSVTDAAGGSSALDTSTVVTATHTTNTAPSVSGAHASTTGDRTADALFSGVTVTDPDTPAQAETATISFTAVNGTLAGAGAATVANGTATYTVSAASASALTTALQAVAFQPTSAPVGAAATSTPVSLSVSDAAGASSPVDTSTVVTATHTTNAAPVIAGVPASATALAAGAVVLAPSLTVTDPDVGAFVRGAQVAIASGFVTGDVLTATAAAGIAASYDAATGVLTLTGPASDAAYQQTLDTVAFSHAGAVVTGVRTVTFGVTDDGGLASNTASETVTVSAYGGAPPVAPPLSPSQSANLATQVDNLLRAAAADPALSDPSSPLYAQVQAGKAVAAQLDAGRIGAADAQSALLHLVDGTTSVAEIAYAFFTGRTPTAAGLSYLVHSPANPTDLDDPYYTAFSTENRYINFAANLGRFGDGAVAFHQAYDGLSLADATAKAYLAIFGAAPAAGKVDAILNALVPDGVGGVETRAQYFAFYGTDGLNGIGTKSAMIGFLLADSVKEGFGTYQQADLHFLQDLAHGTAAFNVDLLAAYTQPPALVGQPMADPTLGS